MQVDSRMKDAFNEMIISGKSGKTLSQGLSPEKHMLNKQTKWIKASSIEGRLLEIVKDALGLVTGKESIEPWTALDGKGERPERHLFRTCGNISSSQS